MKKFGFYALGSKAFECLKSLVSEIGSHPIAFVVVGMDKGVEEDWSEAIKSFCQEHRILVIEKGQCIESDADFIFAIGWRWIIPEYKNLIVLHDSLLPRYRGFAPLVNALINGEKKVGVTALKAVSEYDAGDIIGQKSLDLVYPIKISNVIKAVSALYSSLIIEICNKLLSEKDIDFFPQDNTKASYSLWRNELDYRINWYKDSNYISRFIDAVGYPYKCSVTSMDGRSVRIIDCEKIEDVEVEDREQHVGKVIFSNNGCPVVVCGSGLLRLTNMVDANGDSLIGKIPFRTKFGV